MRITPGFVVISLGLLFLGQGTTVEAGIIDNYLSDFSVNKVVAYVLKQASGWTDLEAGKKSGEFKTTDV